MDNEVVGIPVNVVNQLKDAIHRIGNAMGSQLDESKERFRGESMELIKRLHKTIHKSNKGMGVCLMALLCIVMELIEYMMKNCKTVEATDSRKQNAQWN